MLTLKYITSLRSPFPPSHHARQFYAAHERLLYSSEYVLVRVGNCSLSKKMNDFGEFVINKAAQNSVRDKNSEMREE
jgi:hypothetical protein